MALNGSAIEQRRKEMNWFLRGWEDRACSEFQMSLPLHKNPVRGPLGKSNLIRKAMHSLDAASHDGCGREEATTQAVAVSPRRVI